VLVVFVKKA